MIDEKIVRFITSHHVMTVAAAAGGDLWCANCFYAYLEDEESFVITSDTATRHGGLFLENPDVTGSVVLETEEIGKIQGLQFRAYASLSDGSLTDRYRLAYLRRFPYAVLKGGDVWVLRLTSLKFTDNRLGFGRKLLWNRE